MKTVSEIQDILAEKLPSDLVIPEHDAYGHHYRYVPTNEVFDSTTTKLEILNNPRLKRWAANLAVQYLDRNWDVITPKNKDGHYKAAVLAHEDELKDAGNIGTRGHEAVERYLLKWIASGHQPRDIREFIIGDDARLWAITRSAEQFCNDFEVEPIAAEINVASVKHKFAGQLDSLMILRKQITPGDTNCSHEYKLIRKNGKIERCTKCDREVKRLFAVVDWKTSNQIDKPEYALQVSAYHRGLVELAGLRPEICVIVGLDKDKMKYTVLQLVDIPGAFRTYSYVSKIYDWMHNGITKLMPYSPKKEIFL